MRKGGMRKGCKRLTSGDYERASTIWLRGFHERTLEALIANAPADIQDDLRRRFTEAGQKGREDRMLTQHGICDDEFLITELGLSLSFVNKHSRALGAFKKNPRRYLLSNVLVEALAEANQAKAGNKAQTKAANKERVFKLVKDVYESRGLQFRTRGRKTA